MNSLIFKRVELLSRRVPRPLRPVLYALGSVFWVLGPPLVFVILMVLASFATWGVAWLVYDYKGRPQNWEWRAQRALAAQVANVLQPQRTNRVYFLGLPLDLPASRFRQTIERYRWEDVGEGAMHLNERVALVYGTNDAGRVTRVQVTAEGIDEQQIIGLLGRCMGAWGDPLGSAAPIGSTNRAFEAITWRDDRALVAFDFVPMPGRQQAYRMHLSVYSVLDPTFGARSDTHGFPPAHRHLAELEENIKDREEGNAPPMGPMVGPPGAQIMISPQPGRARPVRPVGPQR